MTKGRILCLILGIAVTSIAFEAQAQWYKAESSVRAISKYETTIFKKLHGIEKRLAEDRVAAGDEKKEAVTDFQARLADAYMDVVFHAYKIKKRKSYLVKLKAEWGPEKAQRIEAFLAKLPRWEGEGNMKPWVTESIFTQAELWADQDMKLAMRNYVPIVNYAARP